MSVRQAPGGKAIIGGGGIKRGAYTHILIERTLAAGFAGSTLALRQRLARKVTSASRLRDCSKCVVGVGDEEAHQRRTNYMSDVPSVAPTFARRRLD